MLQSLLATLLSVTGSWACGDKAASAEAPEGHCGSEEKAQAAVDPSRCARKVELVGAGNCSWSTSMMADRVLQQGAPHTYVGTLVASANQLASRVAAPYTVGPDASVHVVANEVLEKLDGKEVTKLRLELQGKLLEVGGVQYFVVTDFSRGNS